jgi:hypothetical protein
MNPNYTLWYMHGEKTIRGLATSSYSTGPTANAAGVATKNVGDFTGCCVMHSACTRTGKTIVNLR